MENKNQLAQRPGVEIGIDKFLHRTAVSGNLASEHHRCATQSLVEEFLKLGWGIWIKVFIPHSIGQDIQFSLVIVVVLLKFLYLGMHLLAVNEEPSEHHFQRHGLGAKLPLIDGGCVGVKLCFKFFPDFIGKTTVKPIVYPQVSSLVIWHEALCLEF